MTRIRLKKWGKDHFINPKKKAFTLCGLMLPVRTREPKFKGLCVVCRKVYQMQLGGHPVDNSH